MLFKINKKWFIVSKVGVAFVCSILNNLFYTKQVDGRYRRWSL